MSKIEFSIIIPCYNEEGAILSTIKALRDSLGAGNNYELIVVNDGSTDRTTQVLEEAASSDLNLRVLTHQSNRGYGAALKTGIRQAHGELIAITDADGTYPNERLRELVDMAKHADMVVGARIAEDVTYPFIRKIPKVFLKFYASWLAGREIPDMNSGLRVFRRDIAERFLGILPDGFSFTTTITLAMLTNYYHVRYEPISYHARIGKSKIRPIRDTLQFIQLIVRTGMYFAPLRVLLPIVGFLFVTFFSSLAFDIFILENITDKSLMLFIFSMNTLFFALLADMFHKRIK